MAGASLPRWELIATKTRKGRGAAFFVLSPAVICKQAYNPRREQNKTSIVNDACSCFRDPAGIQTRNLLIRSQMLYSVKLRNQRASLKAVQRYGLFWNLEYFQAVFLIKNMNYFEPLL